MIAIEAHHVGGGPPDLVIGGGQDLAQVGAGDDAAGGDVGVRGEAPLGFDGGDGSDEKDGEDRLQRGRRQ
jgi:hypothetical protein